jgi:hypothetical protein
MQTGFSVLTNNNIYSLVYTFVKKDYTNTNQSNISKTKERKLMQIFIARKIVICFFKL